MLEWEWGSFDLDLNLEKMGDEVGVRGAVRDEEHEDRSRWSGSSRK